MAVSQNTRKNIFEAAEQLSYDKYKTKHKTKGTVAVVLSYEETEELHDAYFMSLRIAIDNRLSDSNYRFEHFFQHSYQPADLQKNTYMGIIAVGFFEKTTIQALGNLQKPLVFVNTDTMLYNQNCVVSDAASAPFRAITHLSEVGITDIGVLVGKYYQHQLVTTANDPQRFLLKSLLAAQHLLHTENFFFADDYSAEAGYQAMTTLINKLGNHLPKAFLIGADSIAIGALRALSERNIAVPKQVSLIGFDDITSAKYVSPSLSTIHVSRNSMAKAAFDLLTEQFQKRQLIPRKITVGTALVLRDSSI